MAFLPRPVTRMMLSAPDATASSTPYWMIGLSTSGSISLGCAFVAGKNRVPSPAAGKTALRIFMKTPLKIPSGEGQKASAFGGVSSGLLQPTPAPLRGRGIYISSSVVPPRLSQNEVNFLVAGSLLLWLPVWLVIPPPAHSLFPFR